MKRAIAQLGRLLQEWGTPADEIGSDLIARVRREWQAPRSTRVDLAARHVQTEHSRTTGPRRVMAPSVLRRAS